MSVMNVICVGVQLQSHRKNIEFNETFNWTFPPAIWYQYKGKFIGDENEKKDVVWSTPQFSELTYLCKSAKKITVWEM